MRNKKWKQNVSEGTIKRRKKSIDIKQTYEFKYNDFYIANNSKVLFKSLVVEIGCK